MSFHHRLVCTASVSGTQDPAPPETASKPVIPAASCDYPKPEKVPYIGPRSKCAPSFRDRAMRALTHPSDGASIGRYNDVALQPSTPVPACPAPRSPGQRRSTLTNDLSRSCPVPMSRRGFVRSAALSAAALPTVSRTGTAGAAARDLTPPPGSHRRALPATGGLYAPNAAPLQPTAFQRLPPGSVRPAGWLGGQLQLQLAGLCGRYQDISHFLDYSATGWTNPANAGWEEVPYWLRGYSDLAYATGDQTALSDTERWINGILA